MSQAELHQSVEGNRSRDLGVRISHASRLISGPFGTEGASIGLNTPRTTTVISDAHKATDTAPQLIAMQSLQSLYLIDNTDPQVVSDSMGEAFTKAHDLIQTEAAGTTVSATALKVMDTDAGRVAVIESIGRTRAYRLRDGVLELLTDDDGVQTIERVVEEVPGGKDITIRDQVISGMDAVRDREELLLFKRSQFGMMKGRDFWRQRDKVARALGKNSDLGSAPLIVDVQAGDRFLLADQGVQNLSRDEILHALSTKNSHPAEVVAQRAKSAMDNPRNIRRDVRDINVVIVDIDPRVVEVDLRGGAELVVEYVHEPIELVLPNGITLEVGYTGDLGLKADDEQNMLLLNRPAFKDSNYKLGYQWLNEHAAVMLGHTPDGSNWQWHKGEGDSRLRVYKQDNTVTFQDMNTVEGVKVRYTSLK